MSKRLRAAVIGLGQVGWRFDQETGRGSVWTHIGAYLALAAEFDVVGAYDLSANARQAFAARHQSIRVFSEMRQMIEETLPDVVSICTPNAAHRMTLDAVLAAHRPRAIWCEKPLAISLADGKAMVNACERAQAILVVSHVRRWSPLWRRFKQRIESGEVGALCCLRVAMPNRFWSVGSHAADLLLWLGGPAVAAAAMPIPALEEAGEPAVNALLSFESGATGIMQVTGGKAGLIVEAEAIGEAGRLTLREDTGTIACETFLPSTRYAGYHELGPSDVDKIAHDNKFSPFVAIAHEIAALSSGEDIALTCSGWDALATQALLERLAMAVQPSGKSAAFT
jgi:predicted dehydrogenase